MAGFDPRVGPPDQRVGFHEPGLQGLCTGLKTLLNPVFQALAREHEAVHQKRGKVLVLDLKDVPIVATVLGGQVTA